MQKDQEIEIKHSFCAFKMLLNNTLVNIILIQYNKHIAHMKVTDKIGIDEKGGANDVNF
jgi:hypothetical protein